MPKFQSTKLIEGFSTCFRQWRATHTHCAKLHGYAISFNVTFEAELDQYNWVMDFGFMKRSKTKMRKWFDGTSNGHFGEYTPDEWFKYYFDHTVALAMDDPERERFCALSDAGVIQLRAFPSVGCEMFAKFVADNLNKFLYTETEDRVRVVKVECFEHPKNSAIYIP